MTATPTASPELPDLDRLEALARGLSNIRDQIMQDRVVSVVDVEDLIDQLALARRAQPEGEAPQAEPVNGRITGAHACFSEAMPPGSLTSIGHAHVYKALQAAIAHYVAHQPAARQAESGAPDIEAAAKAIYELLPPCQGKSAKDYPWQPGGNSMKQEEARDYARAALAAQPQGAPSYQVFSHDSGEWYAVDRAQYERAHDSCRRIVAAKAEAPAPSDLALLAALAEAADVFMKGGVAPLRPLIDRAKAITSRAQQAAAPGDEPVAVVDEGDDGLFVDIIYGPDGSALKCGDKLYLATPSAPGTPEAPKAQRKFGRDLYESWSHSQPDRYNIPPWDRLSDEVKSEWKMRAAQLDGGQGEGKKS